MNQSSPIFGQSMTSSGHESAQSNTKTAHHTSTWLPNSPSESKAEMHDSSTLKGGIQTFSQFAQSNEHWNTSQKMDNSLTSVPSRQDLEKTSTGWTLPRTPAKPSTTKWHVASDSHSCMPKSSGTWAPKRRRTKSPMTMCRISPESVSNYSSTSRILFEQHLSLDLLDAARRRGLNGSVSSLPCGCVTWTCYAHSVQGTTNQSSSTICPSATCHEKRKYTLLTQRMKRTSIADTDML